MNLTETIAAIEPIGSGQYRAIHRKLCARLPKTTPKLGRLVDLLTRFSAVKGCIPTTPTKKCAVICCADHGVAAEGVSAYPQETTLDMTANYLIAKGGTANAMSAFARSDLYVLDLGIALSTDHIPGLIRHRVANGTANIAKGAAMTREQAIASLETGIQFVEARVNEGYDCFIPGEMGIANTTSSAAIAAAICHITSDEATGRGTNISDARLKHKIEVVEQILSVNAPNPEDGLDVLMKVGGFEFGCIAGIILGAASTGSIVILDGFNTAAAALIAQALNPNVVSHLLPSHMSAEPAHRATLKKLGMEPLLDMQLRLSEGTGSSLVASLLDSAIALYNIDHAPAPNIAETAASETGCLPALSDVQKIQPASYDTAAHDAAQYRLDNLAKPIYSLGYLEAIVVKLAGVLGDAKPHLDVARTLLVIGQAPPTDEMYRLPAILTTHAGADLSFFSFGSASDIDRIYQAAHMHAKSLARKYPVLALSYAQAMEEHHIAKLASHITDISAPAQMMKAPDIFFRQLPDAIAPYAAATLGTIQGASEEKCLIILDDAFAGLIASGIASTTPSIAEHIYYPCPRLSLHADAPGVFACAGITTLMAGLHALNDMKTFAEASVSVATDGPGKGRQMR